MSWLINAAQLDKFRKNQKNIVILDASWYLSANQKNPKDDFLNQHIVDSRFLDLNLFHDATTTLPNMLSCDPDQIAHRVGELGITRDHKIIFYDQSPLHTSCRALWMFKVFGHNTHQLYILDGGLTAWKQYGGMCEANEPTAKKKSYAVSLQTHLIRTLDAVKKNLHHPIEQVIDMRHPVRFAGGGEERPDMRSGHIPGSVSFPYFTMFDANGCFKSTDKIKKQLTDVTIDLNYPIVSTCGSAMTACILDFVLDLIEHKQHAVYDGSWSEWGVTTLYPGEISLDERPIETC